MAASVVVAGMLLLVILENKKKCSTSRSTSPNHSPITSQIFKCNSGETYSQTKCSSGQRIELNLYIKFDVSLELFISYALQTRQDQRKDPWVGIVVRSNLAHAKNRHHHHQKPGIQLFCAEYTRFHRTYIQMVCIRIILSIHSRIQQRYGIWTNLFGASA